MTFAAGVSLSASLVAAPLSVRVVDASGRPVRDAVVTLYPSGNAGRAPRAGGRYVVSQQHLQFHPSLTIVPAAAGADADAGLLSHAVLPLPQRATDGPARAAVRGCHAGGLRSAVDLHRGSRFARG